MTPRMTMECLSSFGVAIAKYSRLSSLQSKDLYLANSSRGGRAWLRLLVGSGEGLIVDGIAKWVQVWKRQVNRHWRGSKLALCMTTHSHGN